MRSSQTKGGNYPAETRGQPSVLLCNAVNELAAECARVLYIAGVVSQTSFGRRTLGAADTAAKY